MSSNYEKKKPIGNLQWYEIMRRKQILRSLRGCDKQMFSIFYLMRDLYDYQTVLKKPFNILGSKTYLLSGQLQSYNSLSIHPALLQHLWLQRLLPDMVGEHGFKYKYHIWQPHCEDKTPWSLWAQLLCTVRVVIDPLIQLSERKRIRIFPKMLNSSLSESDQQHVTPLKRIWTAN